MAISVTPSAVNQSAIASNDPVNEANVRVRFCRPLPTRYRGAHTGHHLVLADVDPCAPLDQHVHRWPPHPPDTCGGTGGANRSTTL